MEEYFELYEKMRMKKMEKLKPCHFCGGKASLIKNECPDTGYVGWFVYHDCRKFGPHGIKTRLDRDPKSAVEAWNKRKE